MHYQWYTYFIYCIYNIQIRRGMSLTKGGRELIDFHGAGTFVDSLNTGQEIGTETCELDSVVPTDKPPYPEPVYTGWSSVHWNATGMPLVDPVYTGIPLGHLVNTCRVHWNTTGETYMKQPTLECHWRNSNVCSLHWNTTGGTEPHKPRHI